MALIERVLHGLGDVLVRGKADHELPAAHTEALLVERIEGLAALVLGGDEPGLAQDGQVMADGGLGDPDLRGDVADGQALAAAQAHDALAGVVGEGLGKGDNVHRGGLLIDTHRWVII